VTRTRSQFCVPRRNVLGAALRDDAPFLDEDGAVAELAHGAHLVGDEDDRGAALLESAEVLEALPLRGGVADGPHLVDERSGKRWTGTLGSFFPFPHREVGGGLIGHWGEILRDYRKVLRE
jgi:hypothetical protein